MLLAFLGDRRRQSRLDQLRILQTSQAALASSGLRIVGVNVDEAGDAQAARSFAAKERLAFPVLLATQEVAGVYNIIYRYLFDRRRDLPIPCSFLIDANGMIVKVYQGAGASRTASRRSEIGTPYRGPIVCTERFRFAERFTRANSSATTSLMAWRFFSAAIWIKRRRRFKKLLPRNRTTPRLTTISERSICEEMICPTRGITSNKR